MVSCLALALLAASCRRLHAQAAATAHQVEWSAWAFGRLGPSKTSLPGSPIFGSLSGGLVVSRGAIVGMLRATDTEDVSFEDNTPPGEHDFAALAGVRTRGNRLFVVGAAGIARSQPADAAPNSERRLAPAFDISAHADYRVVGVSLTAAGNFGPPPVRYATLSLGAELGWFGWR